MFAFIALLVMFIFRMRAHTQPEPEKIKGDNMAVPANVGESLLQGGDPPPSSSPSAVEESSISPEKKPKKNKEDKDKKKKKKEDKLPEDDGFDKV
jgi:hypothetical protein